MLTLTGDATVIESAFVTTVDAASVTRTVKLDEPATDGKPVIAPVPVSSERPAGSDPTLMAQVYGAVPPAAASVWLYAVLTVPPASDAVEIESGVITVMDRSFVAVLLAVSVARTVKLYVPAVAGVPLILPVEEVRRTPVGSEPLAIAQVYEPVPPVAVTVWLYAAFTAPPGSDAVVTLTADATVIVNERSAVALLASVT